MTNDQDIFVYQLACLLGETDQEPIAKLQRIVERYGVEQAGAWLVETKQIEAAGGEMLPDGSRRRTPGGVFFRVVRRAITNKHWHILFSSEIETHIPQQPDPPKAQQPLSIRTFVRQVARRLGETQQPQYLQLRRIVDRYGIHRVTIWLEETERIEAAGGEMLPDGSRRRTPGGVFFRVVYDAISDHGRRDLFFRKSRKERRILLPDQTIALWNNRDAVIQEAQNQSRKIISVKITIVSKVDKAVERETFTLVTLQHDGNLPTIPTGLPTPTGPLPTNYILYISKRQWARVKNTLQTNDDVIVAEGIPVLDPKYNAITVFVTHTSTKLQQLAQKRVRKDLYVSNGSSE